MTTAVQGSKPGLSRSVTTQSTFSVPAGPLPLPIPQTPNQSTYDFQRDVEANGDSTDKEAKAAGLSLTSSVTSIDAEGNAYPEGGLAAWLVTAGAFASMLVAFGLMNTIGVFQAYLSTHQLSSYPESTIAWIFSVYIFMAFFCGIQIGPIFDARGPRALISSGSVLVVLSVMLTSISTQYWHFMLAFGILGGVGSSLLFTPAVSAIGHYFLIKRGAATGLAAAGGSLGGIIFPLMLQSLLPKVGWGWSLRIMGFILLGLCVLATLLIKSRLPPKKGGSVLPDFHIFKDASFLYVTIGTYFMEWGLFVPIGYLVSYCLSSGAISATFSYQLIAIFNAGSCVGRYLPGLMADKIGRFNATLMALVLCAVLTLSLWLPATILPLYTEEGHPSPAILPLMIVYALLFGFASGSNISLTPVCVGQLCDTQSYGRYYATCYSIVAIGTLTGIPIAGAILEMCGGNYWGVALWTGLCYIIAAAAYLEARRRQVHGLFKWAKV